jgi:hypothetical protein
MTLTAQGSVSLRTQVYPLADANRAVDTSGPGGRGAAGSAYRRRRRSLGAMDRWAGIDRRLERIGQHPFRAKFRLHGRDRATAELRGEPVIRQHACELIRTRLAPAAPYKDGKQTPYRGHPVFVAQHASATCCRTCLERWHEIPKGHELTAEEQAYVVDVICRWITREFHPPAA